LSFSTAGLAPFGQQGGGEEQQLVFLSGGQFHGNAGSLRFSVGEFSHY
jgi:hypothetical protein